MAGDGWQGATMPLWMWGVVAGAVSSVLIAVLWPSGGAGVALLVPPVALVLCSLGALLGWGIGRLRGHHR